MTGIDVPEDIEDRIETERAQDESRAAVLRRVVDEGLEADARMNRLRIGTIVASVAYLGAYMAAGTFGGSVVGGVFIMTLLVWTGLGRLPGLGLLRHLDPRGWR